jgi:hypothetical protein
LGVALVFACSVYEVPQGSSDRSGGAGGSGAGTGGKTSGGASGQGGSASSPGGSSSGSGGSASGSSGSGGSNVVEAGAGGEGGAPPIDECPDDPEKLVPGICGCGIPDSAPETGADCVTLKAALLHRYDFEKTEEDDTEVTDRVGSAHGEVKNGATLSTVGGKGVALLNGGSNGGGYVDLPNKLISSLTDVTIESWVTWGGGDAWQRIFDFGDSTASPPEDNTDEGKTYLFATPKSEDGFLRAGYTVNGNENEVAIDAPPLTLSLLTQVVLVADSKAKKLVLYVDGKSVGEQAWNGSLANINDVNVWLGRSQYEWDPAFSGVFHEFRLYGAALNAAQVELLFEAGTDPGFLAY